MHMRGLGRYILVFVLEREPGSGSLQFSARMVELLPRVDWRMSRQWRVPVQKDNNLYYPFDKFCIYIHVRIQGGSSGES